jgi:hypothetical protein
MVKYWKYKKESAACKSFYVLQKRTVNTAYLVEASLNSFQVMALRNFKEIRKFKP